MAAANARRAMYAPILSRLRLIMIEHMAKPEEVLIPNNRQRRLDE